MMMHTLFLVTVGGALATVRELAPLRAYSVAVLVGLANVRCSASHFPPCNIMGWAQPPAVLELTYTQPENMSTVIVFNGLLAGSPWNANSLLCVSFSAAPRFENGDCDLLFTSGSGEVPSAATSRTLYVSIMSPPNTTGGVEIFAFNVLLLQPVFISGRALVDLPPLAKGQSYMLPDKAVSNALQSQNGVRLSIRQPFASSKIALTVGKFAPGSNACPEAGYVGDNLFAPASEEPEILIPPSYLASGGRYFMMISTSKLYGDAPAAGLRLGVGLYNNCSVMLGNTRSPCSVWGGACKFPCDGMDQCDALGKLPICVCAHGYSGLDCNTVSCTGGTHESCEGSHGVFQRECTLSNQTLATDWSACMPVS